jgi:hypothetical protein
MNNQTFLNFLQRENIGYTNSLLVDIIDYEDFAYCYTYAKKFNEAELQVRFFYIPDNDNFEMQAHKIHSNLWNENKDIAFWVIGNEKTYLVDNKIKPSETKTIIKPIKSFDYGLNNPNFIPNELQKKYFDKQIFLLFLQKENIGYTNSLLVDIIDYEDFAYCYTYAKKFNEAELQVRFFYIPDNDNFETQAHKIHSNLWNENKDIAFWVIGNEKTYLVDNKVKPSETQIITKPITSFNYGVNNPNFAPDELQKSYFDTGNWVNFVIEHSKTKQEVDKELLLDLIALRKDLLTINNDFETIHLLILRCLFIKYLEDRKIYEKDYLLNILKSEKVEKLLVAFDEIAKINGDIFKYETVKKEDILADYLPKLAIFFGAYEYRTKREILFPIYQFDKIPILLISNIYEAFLSSEKKSKNGVFYTPSFAVDFILAQTIDKKLQAGKTDSKVLDPACGSGAFLVESFKRIIAAKEKGKQFSDNEKFIQRRNILQSNQICGIDIDKKALQIAVFSLYVALLENIDETYIREQIAAKQPLLPSLIGKQLVQANTITATENIFEGYIFDCVVGNPPWGSASYQKGKDYEIEIEDKKIRDKINYLHLKPYKRPQKGLKERLIEDKSNEKNIYKNVSDYQKSQAFFLLVDKWLENESIASLVLNSAIFFNEEAAKFRFEVLNKYDILSFYELSQIEIFKSKFIGKEEEKIKVGADEPCAIVVFGKKIKDNNSITYISPKQNKLNKHLQTIHYTSADCKKIKQADLIEEDMLWRIFSRGNWTSYSLIKTKFLEKDSVTLNSYSGFKVKEDSPDKETNPIWRRIIKTYFFKRYYLNKLEDFNYNVVFERDREKNNPTIFQGSRIVITYQPSMADIKLKGVILNDNIIHKQEILCIKLDNVTNLLPYLCCINSKFIGYYLYHISAQWGGKGNYNCLRDTELEQMLPFPFIDFESQEVRDLENLVSQIQTCHANGNIKAVESLENEIDEIVFDLYGLVDSEKEMIREFYEVNIADKGNKEVTKPDLENYIKTFKEVFETVLNHDLVLQAKYRISPNLGAAVSFEIVKKDAVVKIKEDKNLDFLNLVKQKQVKEEEMTKILSEEKVKIYYNDKFYIIKSKLFKDWTKRQAKLDAQEEVGLMLKQLYKK